MVAMGLSLPNSSTTPAESPAKMRECAKAAAAIRVCMEKNITPRRLLTKASFENALVMMMALGGSTNVGPSKLEPQLRIYTDVTFAT